MVCTQQMLAPVRAAPGEVETMVLEARCVFVSFKVTPGNSLAVQWSEPSTSPAGGAQVQSWVGELRCLKPCGAAKIIIVVKLPQSPKGLHPPVKTMVVIKMVMTAADTACCIFTARPHSKCFTNRSHLTLTCRRKERSFPRFADGNIM